jgi:molybdopterin-guanine dinucleotide biosynthesis adapter protein
MPQQVGTSMRVIGLAGWSGAGKTTLLARLIPVLRARGHTVSTLKHAHHAFDIDTPGKDSYEHREAGATEVLISSGKRWALMHELRDQAEPELPELLTHMSPVDLVIVEGFKKSSHLKIEVHRTANEKPPLHPDDASIIAVASDTLFPDAGRPVMSIDDIEVLADYVLVHAEPVGAVLRRLKGG